MEYKEMTVEQLQTRKADIANEIDGLTTIEEVNERSAELEAINSEIESRANIEAKKAEIRNAVANGAGEVTGTFEENKEERKNMEINSVEYRKAWLENLQGKLTAEQRTDYGFTTGGTYATNAIPTIVSDKFFEKMKKLAPMLSEITLLRVAGNVQFIAEGTRNTATKHTENNVVTPAQDTTVKVSLGGYEFMKVIGISKAAQIMSIDAFENWLVEMLAGDIARSLENYILNDSTNGLAYNVLTATSNSLVNTTGNYTYKNIVDLEAMLPAAYDAEAKFLCTKSVLWGKIANITTSTGRPLFVPDPAGERAGRIFGREVVVSDYATGKDGQNALYLGKFTDIVGNLSQDIMVESSEEAGFTANQRMYRGTAVFDSKLAKTDAIVQLVTTI